MGRSARHAAPTAPRLLGLLTVLKVLLSVAPIVAAVAGVMLYPGEWSRALLVPALLLWLLYVVAFRTDFESNIGSIAPTEAVLVGMLVVMPTHWVPAAVLAAVLIASFDMPRAGMAPWQAALAAARSALPAVYASAAFLVLEAVAPDMELLVLVAAAVAVQLTLDAVVVLLVSWLERTTKHVVLPLAWGSAVDAMLAVVGFCVATSLDDHLGRVLILAAPIILVRLLSLDREMAFERAEDFRSLYTEVNQEARRDPMTGLLNRRGWEETLEEADRHLRQSDGGLTATVLVADLDRLKHANDTYGHLAGDGLICGFAELMSENLPAGAAVARLGGDEYAALVLSRATEDTPDLIGALRDALRDADPVGPVDLSASLGQATYPPALDLSTAVDEADHAARTDKEMRRMGRDHLTIVSA